MATVSTFHLLQTGMGLPVQHNVRLDGSPTGKPGVTGVVVQADGLGWCVLADHPANPGVSVTNSAAPYAQAVLEALGRDVSDLAWYEVDSDGNVDELHLMGSSVGFAPLLEAEHPPRSMAALFARAAQLPGGLPLDAVQTLQICADRFVR